MSNDQDIYASATAGSTGYTTSVAVTSYASAMPATAATWKQVEVPPTVKMYPVRTDLPERLLLGIGRIMVCWSHQEWLLQQILFSLSTGDPKVGRLSVTFPRCEEAVTRIEQLAVVRSIIIKTDTSALKKEVKRLERYRDQVGHGIWIVDHANRWCAVVYSGNWEAGEWQGTSKRITPHAKPVDETDLDKHLVEIERAIALTKALAEEVRAANSPRP